MACRVVRNLAIPVVLRKFFIDNFVSSTSQTEHKIVLYKTVPVPFMPTVVTTKNKQDHEPQAREKVEETTLVEDKYVAT